MSRANDPPPREGASQILSAALERDPEDRGAFLADACGGDQALRDEVTDLLAAHEAMPRQFLSEPAASDPELSSNLTADDAAALDAGLAVTVPMKRSATSRLCPWVPPSSV